jgi:hypothetical protein
MKQLKIIKYSYTSVYALPDMLEDFISFWQVKLSEIPEDYRKTAEVEFSADREGYIEINVMYIRPETTKEFTDRQAREVKNTQDTEANERKILKSLIEKYDMKPEVG